MTTASSSSSWKSAIAERSIVDDRGYGDSKSQMGQQPDLSAECLDENVQTNLVVCCWDTSRLHEDDHSMQRAPQHFGQKFRLLPIWPKCGDQLGEASTEGCRRFLAGEFDLCRQDEHRLVDNRPRTGKLEIGGTDVAQNVRCASDVRRFHSQSRRKFFESSSGHCGHDVGLALEVVIENRLAIVDSPARRRVVTASQPSASASSRAAARMSS